MVMHGIDLNSDAIREFCFKWKIKELAVFGSVTREDFKPESDIDFLATFEEGNELDLFDSFTMKDELADLICRPVVDLSIYARGGCNGASFPYRTDRYSISGLRSVPSNLGLGQYTR